MGGPSEKEWLETAQDGSPSFSVNQQSDDSVSASQHALLEKFRPYPINISVSSPSGNVRRESTLPTNLPVAKIVWEGGTLWKVPFHVLGRSKRKYVRLRHGGRNRSRLRISPQPPPVQAPCSIWSPSTMYFAAYPLCLEWGDLDMACPKEFFLKDVIEVRLGRRTPAFQAYMARNGTRSLPDENQCFSIVGAHRTLDLAAETAHEATLWRDALFALLADFEEWKGRSFSPNTAPTPPSPNAVKGWKPDSHGEAMFAAVKEGNVEAFHWHLDRGCPVDFMEEITGDTPLIAACRLGMDKVVKMALEYGAKNDPHPDFGQTALQVAVSTGSTSCSRLIMETAAPSGADVIIVNHEDSNKEASLHIASRCGNLAILELLVLHGANMRLVDTSGRTCLHCSAQGGHSECLRYLLDAGGDSLVEERDNHNLTCLHLAVRANRIECVRILLEAAADAMAATFDGITAIELARRQKSQQMIRMLEEYESELDDEGLLPCPHPTTSCVPDDQGVQADSNKDKSALFEGLDLFTVTCSPSSDAVDAIGNSERFGQLQKYIGASPLSSAFIHDQCSRHVGGIEEVVSPGLISSSHNYRMTPSFSSPRGSSVFRHEEGSYSIGNFVREEGVTHLCDAHHSNHSDPMHEAHGKHFSLIPSQLVGTENMSVEASNVKEFQIDDDFWKICFDSGYPYFFRVRDGHSQWDDPRQHLQFASTATAYMSPIQNTTDSICDGDTFYSLQTPEVVEGQTEHAATSPANKYPILADLKAVVNVSPLMDGARRPTRCEVVESSQSSIVLQPPASDNETVLGKLKVASVGVPTDAIESKLHQDRMSPSESAQKTSYDVKDVSLSHYDRMVSVGVPMASVRHKMTQDGIDQHKIKVFVTRHEAAEADLSTINCIGGVLPVPPKEPTASKATEIEVETGTAPTKYSKMLLVGVPPDSVIHKMKADGVSSSAIESFVQRNKLEVSDKNIESSKKSGSDEQFSCPSKEDLMMDEELSKFVKMAAVGVPAAAVARKMGLENVPAEKVFMFKRAFGLVSKEEIGQKETVSQAAGHPLPPCPPSGRRPTVKMQKIHWKPVAEEKLHDSLWASGDFAESDVDQAELEQLESLFGAKSPTLQRKIAPAKSKKKEIQLIELKRANNVAISLAQFRAFKHYDELCQAVVAHNCEHLDSEKLVNLQSLLPTFQELETIKKHKAGTEGLGSAELFFFAVSKIPRFAQKLHAFLSALQFPDQVKETMHMLELLGNACSQVIESQKLASMLRRLLVVGNIMNESSGKPKAAGITLDSLLKTAKKKGTDKKTTVLDHVVATLMKQGDPENTMDFWQTMHNVRNAIRVDIREIRTSFKELQVRMRTVHATLELEEKNLQEGTACPSTRKFVECSHSFTAKAKEYIEEIGSKLKVVEGKVKCLCSFFAEDESLCQSTSIFGVLVEFAKLVEKSKESWSRKKRAEKRRVAMNTPIKTFRGTPTKPSRQEENSRSQLLQSISRRRLCIPSSDGDEQ